METINLADLKIASFEQKAEEFLIAKGILKTFVPCLFLGNKIIGKVRRNFLGATDVRKSGVLEKIAYLKI